MARHAECDCMAFTGVCCRHGLPCLQAAQHGAPHCAVGGAAGCGHRTGQGGGSERGMCAGLHCSHTPAAGVSDMPCMPHPSLECLQPHSRCSSPSLTHCMPPLHPAPQICQCAPEAPDFRVVDLQAWKVLDSSQSGRAAQQITYQVRGVRAAMCLELVARVWQVACKGSPVACTTTGGRVPPLPFQSRHIASLPHSTHTGGTPQAGQRCRVRLPVPRRQAHAPEPARQPGAEPRRQADCAEPQGAARPGTRRQHGGGAGCGGAAPAAGGGAAAALSAQVDCGSGVDGPHRRPGGEAGSMAVRLDEGVSVPCREAASLCRGCMCLPCGTHRTMLDPVCSPPCLCRTGCATLRHPAPRWAGSCLAEAGLGWLAVHVGVSSGH